MTYLAVPIAGEDVCAAGSQIKSARKAGAEMVELRTDYLAELNADNVRKMIKSAKATKLPMIVTCRDKAQGGAGDWPMQLRAEILVAAVEAGVDYIDCEYDNFLIGDVRDAIEGAMAKQGDVRLILSAHNFAGAFDDLGALYDDICSSYPGAIPKLVYAAGHVNDCFEGFDLLHNKVGDAIVLCMGEAGLISRVLATSL